MTPPKPQYLYPICSWSGYDADSYNLTLDLGFELVFHTKVRIEGIDTTELRDRRGNFKAFAYLAKQIAHSWMQDRFENGSIYFKSMTYRGKYGRPLGDVVDSGGNSLSAYLLDQRVAVPYEGQNKLEVEAAHLANMDFISKMEGKDDDEQS